VDTALLGITAAFASMLLSANLATPLYVGYSAQFGFSTAILALIFAVYALVLIPSLPVFGQLSDRFGRRRVIAPGWDCPSSRWSCSRWPKTSRGCSPRGGRGGRPRA
jgi:MFS family permease